MAQLLSPFNANAHDPSQVGGQLPIGRHRVIINNSEIKATKKNDGGYLQLTLQVIEGPSAGAEGPYRLNIYSASEAAAGIANRQLSAICHVTGVFNVQDTQQLHGIPFMVEIGQQAGENSQYTEVKKVFDANGNEPSKQGQTPAAAPANAFQAPQQQQSQQAPAQWAQPAQGAAQAAAPAWGAPPAQEQAPAQQQPSWQPPAASGSTPPWGQR